jgi:hypothetical protein
MRADSLGGRIVGAVARDPAVGSSGAGASAEPPGWTGQGGGGRPWRPRRLRRSSMLGRVVAALARVETALPAGPVTQTLQEDPTPDAELTILIADLQPAGQATRPARSSVPAYPGEPVEPTAQARLGIITVPA